MQQILKIAAAAHLGFDVPVFCDSDVVFVRPFDPAAVGDGHAVGLLDVDFVNDEVRDWTSVAGRLLGLPAGVPTRGHVGQVILWRRDRARDLIDRIERVTGRDWRVALMRTTDFSEYILYGTFIREVIGYPESGHVPSTAPLVHSLWGPDLTETEVREAFGAVPDPATVAVMVHSKGGVSPAFYRHLALACWERQ